MKLTRLLLALVLLVGLAACEQKPKTTTEKIKDKVDDALDRRSNEKLRDAAEELQEGAKEVSKELKEAEKEIAKELEGTPQKPGK
jgi:predicted lipoprotein